MLCVSARSVFCIRLQSEGRPSRTFCCLGLWLQYQWACTAYMSCCRCTTPSNGQVHVILCSLLMAVGVSCCFCLVLRPARCLLLQRVLIVKHVDEAGPKAVYCMDSAETCCATVACACQRPRNICWCDKFSSVHPHDQAECSF